MPLIALFALLSAPANAEQASVRVLTETAELVSVRAAAQNLYAVWSGDSLLVRYSQGSDVHWAELVQPDAFEVGLTLPGHLVGLPGREIFVGFEGLDSWSFEGPGDELVAETLSVTGSTNITNWMLEIEGVTQGALVKQGATLHAAQADGIEPGAVFELWTDAAFWTDSPSAYTTWCHGDHE